MHMNIVGLIIFSAILDFLAGFLVYDAMSDVVGWENGNVDDADWGAAIFKILITLLIAGSVTGGTIYKAGDTLKAPVVKTAVKPVVDTTVTIHNSKADTLYTYTFTRPE